MAKSKYEIEIERAQNDTRSSEITSFNASVRQIGLNNLENGDIVTIPAGYKAFEQTIPGSDAKAQYLIANVKRGKEEIALRFYPSSFTKMGTTVKAVGDDSFVKDKFVHATGTVVDHVQQHADMNEALKSLVGKPFTVGLTPVNLVTFEAREKTELTSDDVRKTNIPQYDFVK